MDTDFSFKAIKMFWNLIKVVATYCECKRMYTLKCLIFLLCQFYLQKKKMTESHWASQRTELWEIKLNRL